MQKKIKQRLLKNRLHKARSKSTLNLAEALKHIDAVVLASERIPNLASDFRASDSTLDRLEKTRRQLALIEGLLNARRLSYAEFVFHASSCIERIHEDRWMGGAYNVELDPISKELRELELKQGLKEGQFWLIKDMPRANRALTKKYDLVLETHFCSELEEFGLVELARLRRESKPEFDSLREKGRRVVFHVEDTNEALKDFALQLEEEAYLAANAGAYLAGTTCLASSLEALLLLRCLKSAKKAVAVAKKLPAKKRPQKTSDLHRWTFENLIDVCLNAGWLSPVESAMAVYDPSGIAHDLRKERNRIHPGKSIRESPWRETGSHEFRLIEAMYKTVQSKLLR